MIKKNSTNKINSVFFIHIPKTGGSYVKPGSNKNQFSLWPIESHGHSYVVHKDGIQNFLYYPHMKDWLYRTTVNIEIISSKYMRDYNQRSFIYKNQLIGGIWKENMSIGTW